MSEKKPFQQCPICGAVQPLSTRKCSICGAVLPGELTPVVSVPPVGEGAAKDPRAHYDPAVGDDDLYVGDLPGRMWRLVLVGCAGVALVFGLGIGLVASRMIWDGHQGNGGARVENIPAGSATAPPTATLRGALFVAPTAVATRAMPLGLATVTPAPPTPTDTPTPGPCYQTAQTGDTVFGMAIRCGHRDMAIVDTILEINHMKSPQELQVGQTLEIPWPTPTPGGEPTGETSTTAGTGGGGALPATEAAPQVSVNEFGTPDMLATYQTAEPTLRPGQAWHTVQSGETILSIAIDYDTTIEVLSQINPEIPFLQCDYGSPSGGPNCSVMLTIGQRVRVPVPLPTMTPTPSPAGTLTPTPSATPTFNAPYLLSPPDNAHFRADEMVTLRWGGTGTLAAEERYVVRVRDLGTGEVYMAAITDTTYILPGGWQPSDGNRHTFEWTISVARVDAQYNILSEEHATDPRRFTWDSR
jgi:LysM repeat protein